MKKVLDLEVDGRIVSFAKLLYLDLFSRLRTNGRTTAVVENFVLNGYEIT